ncbi:EamA/RhaT family transporter [Archaeoglobales archaeon]|nr:MAG: EamA/RhaT family transporter [Archaeoglobales archaeon]
MLGITFAVISSILWGFNGILLRKGLEGVDTISGTFTVVSTTTLIASLVALKDLSSTFIDYNKVLMLALAGIISYFIGRLFTYSSVSTIGSSRAFSGTSTRILFSAIFGVFLLHEMLNLPILFGTAMMIVGLYIFSTEGFAIKGIYASVAGGFAYGLASLLIKVGMLNSVFVSVFVASISGLTFLGMFAKTQNRLKFVKNKYLVLSGTSLAFGNISYYLALSMAPIVIVVPLSNLYPLVTTLLSYLLIQKLESVGIKTFLGSLLAVIGSILIAVGRV